MFSVAMERNENDEQFDFPVSLENQNSVLNFQNLVDFSDDPIRLWIFSIEKNFQSLIIYHHRPTRPPFPALKIEKAEKWCVYKIRMVL